MHSRLSKYLKGIKGAEDIYELVVSGTHSWCTDLTWYEACQNEAALSTLSSQVQLRSSSLVKFEQQRVGVLSEVFSCVCFLMGMDGNVEERMTTSEYLAQLLKDKKQLQSFPNAFVHLERILDDGMYSVCLCVSCVYCDYMFKFAYMYIDIYVLVSVCIFIIALQ